MNYKKRIVQGICGMIVGIVILLFIFPYFEHADKKGNLGSKNWMAKIADDRDLSDINIPGTHDSATQYVQLPFFSRCQDKNIYEQLEMGIRYLDIRLAVSDRKLMLMHDFTHAKVNAIPFSKDLSLDRVLDDCYKFIKKNPSETIVFVVRHEYGNESKTEFQNILNSYVQKNREYWYLSDKIPTLKEARGKIVLMRRYEDEADLEINSGLNGEWSEPNQKSDNELLKIASHSQLDSYSLFVQDLYDYDTTEKWKAFLMFLNYVEKENPEDICINFLSTKGSFVYGHPYYFAKQLNKKLLNRKLINQKKYGWIILDFADAQLAKHIYETNF